MTASRIERLRERLADALQPEHLDIIDESHLHVGHAGAREGKGHFRVRIVSQAFNGLNAIQRHRLVYQAAGDMLTSDIHALSIEADTPSP